MLLLIGAAFLYEWFASSQAKKDFPPPGTLVQVDGYQLHMHKQGNGSPTILMEAGSGETSLSWRDIPAELAQHATVVTYDRAGYAWSESAPTERTGANIVKDLHAALEKENIRGPYIMVGHSLGGMYARLFAQTYANEVQSLVLIDARPEDDERDTKALLEQAQFQGNPPASLLSLLKVSGTFRLFPDFMLDGLVAKQDRDTFVNVIATPPIFTPKKKKPSTPIQQKMRFVAKVLDRSLYVSLHAAVLKTMLKQGFRLKLGRSSNPYGNRDSVIC